MYVTRAQSGVPKVFITDAHAHIQRLVSVIKMATFPEERTEEERSVLQFLGGKRTQCKGYS
jgi:hypothetical protein